MKSVSLCILLTVAICGIAFADWPDPVAEDVIPARSAGLTHGPMLGGPGATSMRVWIRTEAPMDFKVRYSTTLPLGPQSPVAAGKTVSNSDNTGTVELTGLKPLTRYYYGIELNGKLADTRVVFTDPWPSFRTLPDASSVVDAQNNPDGRYNVAFSISVGGSQDPKRSGGQYTDPPSWGTLYRKFGDEIQFHIMNGDYTYEELRDGTPNGIRANYKRYLDRSREMSRLQGHVPWLFMFDDHEVNDNLFGAGQVGFKRRSSRHTNRDTQLNVWYEYAGWANDPAPQRGPMLQGRATVKNGSSVLECTTMDFSQLTPEQVSTILVRKSDKTNGKGDAKNAGTYGLAKVVNKHRIEVTPAFVADEDVVFTVGTHHYFDRKEGNCHFFFIDTRGERSMFNKDRLDAPENFLIGKTQREWLVKGVKASDADFFFIISSVGVVVPHSGFHVRPEGGDKSKGDGFPGFVHEREIILKELDQIKKPIMFLTGDVHASVCAQLTDNLWEFMVSPMSSNGHPIGTLGNMPYSGWYKAEGRWAKIKWVGSGPNNVHYSRLHRTFFAVVRVNNVFKVPRPDNERGPGYQIIPYEHPHATITWYDGYSGRPAYSQTVSTLDLVKQPE